MRQRPHLLVGLLVLVTAAGLTGCTNGDDSGGTTTTTSSATSGATSASPATESSTQTAAAGPASTGPELADRLAPALVEAGSYRATMANPEGGDPARAEASIAGDTLALHVRLDGKTQLTRIDGQGIWYTNEQGNWANGADLGAAAGMFDEILFSFDARSQIAGLKALPTMNNLGTEEINGVSTTHYQGGAPAADFGNALTPKSDALQTTGGDVAIDVWVDEQNRIVRFGYLLIPGDDAADQPSPTQQITDYSDYGASILVEAPKLG